MKAILKRYLGLMIGLIFVAGAGLLAVFWFTFRVYVPEDKCAVLIRKMGETLPAEDLVATKPGQRGIQEEVLGPGRYFYNPLIWDYKIVDLTVVPAGAPLTWEWRRANDAREDQGIQAGAHRFRGEFPQIGVVTRRVGKDPGEGEVIVDRESGTKGILREVLTPGTYKINPYVYDVALHPAVVIPAGFVGVVTNLFGVTPDMPDTPILAELDGVNGDEVLTESEPARSVRPLATPGQRGTLRDVLQPGVYYINPKLQKVTVIEIGYNEYSQVRISEAENFRISFPSDTGYLIRVGVTVVWGVDPRHAAEVINEFGNVDGVLDKVIGPQLRSICRNIGSTYAARDFIQGEKREMFQKALTLELQRVCRQKNLEVILALVREIEVHAPSGAGEGAEVTEDLKRTIQQSHIAIENQITKDKQREAAIVRAELEQEWKKVDIARESIRGQSRVMVANILAEGEKTAAEIDARAQLEVATIQQQVAELDAQRIEILGQAHADVERMKQDAEAQGYQLLVDAMGGGQAFNLYTFAENFNPERISLIFAGDGTFWTDLTRFEEVGAARLLQQPQGKESSR